MRTTTRNRLIGALLTITSVLLFFWSIIAFFAGDACLDDGGSFNYLVLACDFRQNHESYFLASLVVGFASILVGLLGIRFILGDWIDAP